jgi:hypothetical protein
MPEPRQYVEQRTALETLVGWIPGFHGYLEKEYRRDSDALQRKWLADRLQRSKRAIDAIALRLADAGQLPLLPLCDRLRASVDHLIARIRGAWEGYTGVFDLVKVDTTLLDKLYDHDVGLMHSVEEFVTLLEKLAGMPPSADAIAKPPAPAVPVGAGSPATDNPVPQAALVEAPPPEAPLPSDPAAALPLLAAKLDVIQQGCDARADLLKGLG